MSGTTYLVNCSFTAANGTPLESYSNGSDVAATWTKLSAAGATVQGNQMAIGGVGVFYRSVPMTVADYVVFFKVFPTSYTSVTRPTLWAIARNVGDTVSGYKLQVAGDGSQYNLQLVVGTGGGTALSVPMGTIASAYYQAELVVSGAVISGSVQRLTDSMWLQPGGAWATGYAAALVIASDTTYTAPGYVVIGGSTG